MKTVSRVALVVSTAVTCAVATAAVRAQVLPPPQNVVSLSAQASVEVPRDWLSITLAATREAADAATVQLQLRQALDAALAEARKAARPGQAEVRTGQFAVSPRYAPKGGIAGWQGSAELTIEGRDVAAISALAGRLPTMAVSRITQGLSREAREKAEAEVAAQAIERFRARAEAYAKLFGFGAYTIREVSVGGADAMPVPLRMNAMALAAASDTAVPVEGGRATVTVTVSGSIQMTPR